MGQAVRSSEHLKGLGPVAGPGQRLQEPNWSGFSRTRWGSQERNRRWVTPSCVPGATAKRAEVEGEEGGGVTAGDLRPWPLSWHPSAFFHRWLTGCNSAPTTWILKYLCRGEVHVPATVNRVGILWRMHKAWRGFSLSVSQESRASSVAVTPALPVRLMKGLLPLSLCVAFTQCPPRGFQ